MVEIRQTTPDDEPVIHAVHTQAFGPYEGPTIADLTHALLHDSTAQPMLSLLAMESSNAIGHVLFTRVTIAPAAGNPPEAARPAAHILAPLAVIPEYQRRGIGAQLIEQGLTSLTQSGSALVFVLGHPEYYPRFGFTPAGREGLSAPYPIPEKNADAWMVRELTPGAIDQAQGMVQCAEALNKREYWIE